MKNEVIDEKEENKKEKFYMLSDRIVKKLFTNGSKASEDLLYLIISKAIKVPIENLKRDFKIMHPEIALNDKNINSEADLVYENDKIYISLEINYSDYKSLSKKNFSYVCCLYLRDLLPNSDYKNLKEVYSINIDGFDYFGQNKFIYESEMIEKNLLMPRNLGIHCIDINLEYLEKLGYNNITDELEKSLYIFVCNNKNILYELYEEGSFMREFLKEAEKLSHDLDELLYYDKKKLDQEMVYNNGKEDGIEQGIEQGIEEGEKRKSLEIAKNLINQEISIDVISKATGLTKEEIENLP